MKDLDGKRALVTGASRGIGRAIALALAGSGADVAITFEKSTDQARQVVDEINALGRRGAAFAANSADPEAVRAAVADAVSELGGLDILVNNAGIFRFGPLEEMDLETINAVLDINVRSVVVATQAAIPHLSQGSRIINIGSNLAQRVPMSGLSIYSMSKSALLAFTQGMARELGPRGITVNIVNPGPTETDMNPADGEFADKQRSFIALGHYGKAQDVAGAVKFLSGPDARHISGAAIAVDGGLNA